MVEKRPQILHADVVLHSAITENIRRLTLSAPTIAQAAEPGQFINIRVSTSFDPLLRRPFSLNRINRADGTISILYKIMGSGTALLSRCRTGDKVDVLGPLGKGFVVSSKVSNAVLIAGGMGIAPFFPLAEQLLKSQRSVTCLYGIRCADDLVDATEIEKLGVRVLTASEDGCGDYHGTVTDLLTTTLRQEHFALGLACGPHAMLAAVKEICTSAAMPLQVSLEGIMACGLGVCLGCTCQKENSSGYWHVCTDGPVFPAEDVKF